MSKKRVSTVEATLIGVRVAGEPLYTPAYIPTGANKPIRQRAEVSVIQNIGDTKNTYKLTAWGPMADVIAKSCAPGKDITVTCEVHTYKGKVPLASNVQNAPVQYATDSNGQAVLANKVGFTIKTIHFGADSENQLINEIADGSRPAFWNVIDHQDYINWKAWKDQRNGIKYVMGNQRFGYSKVRQPNGQIIDPATINSYNAAGTAVVNQYAGNTAAVSGRFAMPNPNTPPVVKVHGEHMGFAMPNQQVQPVPQTGGSFQM